MSTKAKRPITLRLVGELTVRTAADIHQKLMSELAKTNALLIDASEASEADLTFVQLIESARRMNGKTIAFAAPLPPPVLDVVQRGGFLSASGGASFWKPGE